ncbi:MAG TPA: endolytic transglycosylase MltG [Flavisolibacter sp.]
MKKLLLALLFLLLIGAGVAGWILFGSATGFSASKKFLYIRSNAATKKAVLDSLEKNDLVTNTLAFEWLGERMDYWKKVRPGKYEIRNGASLVGIVRMLRNGRQSPVNLVIGRVRTREDLARMVGNRFEVDSSDMIGFLESTDSLQPFQVTPETAFANILPDTYTYFWTASPRSIYKKIYDVSQKFWNAERKQKAAAIGLTPLQVYSLASIIEEETTNDEEKPVIASVYLNRLQKNMPLQADPTVKFALKDFSITRIYSKHTAVESPYNTYKNPGIPPGPICTPTRRTIDAVLNPAQTKYLFFVASPSMKQEHVFSETFEEHLVKARQYQQELDRRDSIRKQKQQTP